MCVPVAELQAVADVVGVGVMTHDQVRDSIFVDDEVLAARRRAQSTQLQQERRKLVINMLNQAGRVNKIDSLLFLLE